MDCDPAAIDDVLNNVRQRLLDQRTPAGHWEGELSSSALSTATAVFALSKVDGAALDRAAHSTPVAGPHAAMIRRGLGWLAAHANADGGWGDTVLSHSNISTTALCWAAFAAADDPAPYRETVARAEAWLTRAVAQAPPRQKGSRAAPPPGLPGANGVPRWTAAPREPHVTELVPPRGEDVPPETALAPDRLAAAISARYGKDHTFSVPILTMCALAGRLGEGREAWRHVAALPFELAALPQAWFRWMRLPVVSYALPALIAIGQARHHHRPTRNPAARIARLAARRRTLRVLEAIQPAGGGFLEATPLTSFVVMSLAGSGLADHPVVARGVEFLERAAGPDGSWPIDTNLATWVTTLSVNALYGRPHDPSPVPPAGPLSDAERETLVAWLLGQQYRVRHPYTGAAPGAWAWTDLPGGVPDADDTAGALIALRRLAPADERCRSAASAGLDWLMGLQNRDGGVPTFCRGWGALPFDRSGADLTAHAVHAAAEWVDDLDLRRQRRARKFLAGCLRYLEASQHGDGRWEPLWFGNQFMPDDANPVYGTARVLVGLRALVGSPSPALPAAFRQRAWGLCEKGGRWLIAAQNPDGGWGGGTATPPSIEETALALDALAGFVPGASDAVRRGCAWLVARTEGGRSLSASPIGLYFAKLWYFERLYPLIFTAAALGRMRVSLSSLRTGPSAHAGW